MTSYWPLHYNSSLPSAKKLNKFYIFSNIHYKISPQDFPVFQWLRLRTSTAGGVGSIPGVGELRSCMPGGVAKKKKKKIPLKLIAAGNFESLTSFYILKN